MTSYAVTLNPTLHDDGPRYEVRATTPLAAYGQVMRALGRSDKHTTATTDTRGAAWIIAPDRTARVDHLHRAPDRNLRPSLF